MGNSVLQSLNGILQRPGLLLVIIALLSHSTHVPSALNVKGLQAINEKLQTALDAARMEAEVARRRSGHSKICETEEERSWHLRILKNIKLNLWPIEVFIALC